MNLSSNHHLGVAIVVHDVDSDSYRDMRTKVAILTLIFIIKSSIQLFSFYRLIGEIILVNITFGLW